MLIITTLTFIYFLYFVMTIGYTCVGFCCLRGGIHPQSSAGYESKWHVIAVRLALSIELPDLMGRKTSTSREHVIT